MPNPSTGPGVTASMMLCDAAQKKGGKLYILGGGWTQVKAITPPPPMSLAIQISIPWDQGNERMALEVVLLTADGDEVDLGNGPVKGAGELEAGRPPGLRAGTPLDTTLVMNFLNLKLTTGGYVWELRVAGNPKARCPFRVVKAEKNG